MYLLLIVALFAACRSTPAESPNTTSPNRTNSSSTNSNEVDVTSTDTTSDPVGDGRLEIRLEIRPDVVVDRIPMRTANLHFRNVSAEPLRIYLPVSDAFRFSISTITLSPASGPPLTVPTPRPHGYVVTEADFHLLQPNESRNFAQQFTIDPFAPGGGLKSVRRTGFESGSSVQVRWTYENSIERWQGGSQTLDGPTKRLFDGGDIPYIWTGSLTVAQGWTVP